MNKALVARTWADFRLNWRQPLAFHLLMQLLGFAIFAPLVTWIGRRIVLASGEPVISNFDIAAFVLSASGAVFVLVVAALTVSLLLAEFAGLSWIAGHAIARQPVTVASTIAFVLRKLPSLIVLSARVFLRLALLALPFLAAAGLVWLTMLNGHDINYYLAEHPPEWQRAKVIAVILVVAYGLLAGLAARALAVRGADPHLRRRHAGAGARGQCAHDAGPARANRDSPLAVVAAAHCGDRSDHLGVP